MRICSSHRPLTESRVNTRSVVSLPVKRSHHTETTSTEQAESIANQRL